MSSKSSTSSSSSASKQKNPRMREDFDDRQPSNESSNFRNKRRKYSEEQEDISQYEFGKPHYSGREPTSNKPESEEKAKPIDKPSFHLSGKLSLDQRTLANGTILKFVEPADSKVPTSKWLLMPFKDNKPLGKHATPSHVTSLTSLPYSKSCSTALS